MAKCNFFPLYCINNKPLIILKFHYLGNYVHLAKNNIDVCILNKNRNKYSNKKQSYSMCGQIIGTTFIWWLAETSVRSKIWFLLKRFKNKSFGKDLILVKIRSNFQMETKQKAFFKLTFGSKIIRALEIIRSKKFKPNVVLWRSLNFIMFIRSMRWWKLATKPEKNRKYYRKCSKFFCWLY